MRILSFPTAFWGLPSMAALGLGISLLANQPKVEKNYLDYIKKTSISYPLIQDIDSLDNSGDNLKSAEEELTYYCSKPYSEIYTGNTTIISPAIYHYPDVNDSLKDLSFARGNIGNIKFADKTKIKNLENKIGIVQEELSKIEKGKSESFYEPQRKEINYTEKMAEEEMRRLESLTSTKIVDERRTLRNKKENKNSLGMILTIFAGLSTFGWGFWRFLNINEIDFDYNGF
jgi:hypothetical protein